MFIIFNNIILVSNVYKVPVLLSQNQINLRCFKSITNKEKQSWVNSYSFSYIEPSKFICLRQQNRLFSINFKGDILAPIVRQL